MYKIGDKVETIYGACVIENHDKVLRIYHTKHIKSQRLFMFYEDSLDILGLYRTAHDKLIEMGYRFWDNSNGLQYNKDHIEILIDKEEKVYKVYWMVDYQAYDVDLTLSRILTQYLEELEE